MIHRQVVGDANQPCSEWGTRLFKRWQRSYCPNEYFGSYIFGIGGLVKSLVQIPVHWPRMRIVQGRKSFDFSSLGSEDKLLFTAVNYHQQTPSGPGRERLGLECGCNRRNIIS